MKNVAGEQGLASASTAISIQIFLLLEIQTVIHSHSLMMGTSNVAILIFSPCFFPFLAFVKLKPIILGKISHT